MAEAVTAGAGGHARKPASDDWLHGWLASLHLHRAVAPVLPGEGSFDAIKALTRSELHEVLKSAGLEGLLDSLWMGIQELRQQSAATGSQLNSKFAASDGTFTLSYGGLNTFFHGLDGLVGPPNPNLATSIDHEHTSSPDSRLSFTTANYGVTTTSQMEYLFVTSPVQGLEVLGLEAWPAESKVHDEQCRRQPKELGSFEAQRKEHMAKLQLEDCAPLSLEELTGLRLYTGPM